MRVVDASVLLYAVNTAADDHEESRRRLDDVLSGLFSQVGAGRNLVNDAHLAALAIERRARVVIYHSDFGRFDGVLWEIPGSLLN